MEISIIAETQDGGLNAVTNQLVSAAIQLGASPTVIIAGGAAAEAAANIAGVGRVIAVVGDCFSEFDGSAWASALDAVIPSGLILGAATTTGRDVAARIAARRNIPVIQDITAVEGSATLTVTHPIYSGKATETLSVEGDCVLTIRANTYPPAAVGGSADISTVNQSADVSLAVKEMIAKASERLDVSEADIIISGGRGMGDPDNFSHLFEIAEAIGAAVGASRAAVDTWPDKIPHSMQVGQTGKTVNPTLYIAVGISGAIQHIAGMRTSKYIVAINKDAEAPIFKLADYGIVATWEEALPVLREELAKLS
jgi:electron transfer flavoprotein alpha subunit